MHCSDFAEWIAQKLEGTLPEGQARRLDEHLSECTRCRAELLLQRKIRDALSEETHSGLSADFTQLVSGKVLEIAGRERRTGRWVDLVPAFTLGAAAIALILVGADLVRVLPSPGELVSSTIFKPIGWFLQSFFGVFAGAVDYLQRQISALGLDPGSLTKTLFIALVGSLPGIWGLHKIVEFIKE